MDFHDAWWRQTRAMHFARDRLVIEEENTQTALQSMLRSMRS
jgi:hypothetical protein